MTDKEPQGQGGLNSPGWSAKSIISEVHNVRETKLRHARIPDLTTQIWTRRFGYIVAMMILGTLSYVWGLATILFSLKYWTIMPFSLLINALFVLCVIVCTRPYTIPRSEATVTTVTGVPLMIDHDDVVNIDGPADDGETTTRIVQRDHKS